MKVSPTGFTAEHKGRLKLIEKMKRKIRGATGPIIGVYVVLFLWLVSPSWWVGFLSEPPPWVEWVPLVLGGIGYFLVILDIHNWIDSKFFKERRKVDNYIRDQLTTPCREMPCARAKRGILEDEEQKLMSLFYTFIPADDTERERAFSYWGDYFITVNLSAISILGFIGALIAIAFDVSRVTHPAFFIILALTPLFNFARIKTRKKLLYPAQAQTNRILSENCGVLKIRLPEYRSQCQKCPLTNNSP